MMVPSWRMVFFFFSLSSFCHANGAFPVAVVVPPAGQVYYLLLLFKRHAGVGDRREEGREREKEEQLRA